MRERGACTARSQPSTSVLTSLGLYFSWTIASAASDPGAMASGKAPKSIVIFDRTANLQKGDTSPAACYEPKPQHRHCFAPSSHPPATPPAAIALTCL